MRSQGHPVFVFSFIGQVTVTALWLSELFAEAILIACFCRSVWTWHLASWKVL